MTDETPPKDARKLTAAEYKAARAELVHEAIEAERKTRNDRDQAAFEANFTSKKDANK